ncbi:MAG TPA: PqqD family protein [Acidimicrobiia bacterium]|nr:PqqD family protein [Acidimicrobiia bacterium]
MKLRSDDLVWQKVDADIVVLDLRTSIYFRINGSGAVLWEQLATEATNTDLENSLVARYGISAEKATSDVIAFLADARDRGFLEE